MNAPLALPRGTHFVRYAMALGQSRGDVMQAAEIATRTWGAPSPPAQILRAAATSGSTLPGGAWGSELATYDAVSAEFFTLVRERSIIGRMAGLRRVPLQVRLVSQTSSTSAHWVAQGKAKPISQMAFADATLPALKIASVAVVSQELFLVSSPDSESRLRDDLVNALVIGIDLAFTDPENAGIPDEMPAAITDGVSAIPATGDPTADLKALIAAFGGDLETAFFIMRGEIAAALAGTAHPNVGARGGELLGVPVITSSNAPADTIILADAAGIALGEGMLELDVNQHGAVQMSSTPDDPATSLVSLWQGNLVALRAEKAMNWAVARDGAVVYLTGVSG